ncbi:MAG: hypothetical protein IT269_03470, partial [Saprospiraceae bacterium]|nr:hypothetical protein [Saprospiraceae bacterium]
MRPITLFFLLLLSAQASAQLLSWSFSCSDKNFCLDQNSCTQGTVMMTAEATTFCSSPIVNYSYKIDLSSNGSIDQQASGSAVSGTFPAGNHRVTWKATDNC